MNTKAELNDKALDQVTGGTAAYHIDKSIVLNRIINLLKEQLGLNRIDICSESKIIEDLCADSLDLVDIMQQVEDEFHIMLTEAAIFSVKTIEDLYNLVIMSLNM